MSAPVNTTAKFLPSTDAIVEVDEDRYQEEKKERVVMARQDDLSITADLTSPQLPVIDDPVTMLRKKVLRVNMLGTAIGALSSVIIFYFILRASLSFQGSYFPFDAIRLNWGREVIWDIIPMQQGTCPQDKGMNYTDVFVHEWPGVLAGCDCTAATKGTKDIFNATCSTEQITFGCKATPPMDPKELFKWKAEDRLCQRRVKGISMHTMVLNSDYNSNSRCRPGYKICPPDHRDPNNPVKDSSRRMCVPEWMNRCPITDVKIGRCDVVPNQGSGCFVDSPTDKIVLTGTTCLWKSFTCGRGPISKIMIGEESVCRIDDFENQIARNHTDHPLILKPRKRCDPNENAYEIDRISQPEFLAAHSINHGLIAGLTENIRNFTYSLFAINYAKFEWTHRTSTDLSIIFNNQSNMERLQRFHWMSLCFFGLAILLYFIAIPILFYVETRHPRMYKNEPVKLFCKYILLFFFKIFSLPVITLLMHFNEQISSRFKKYSESSFSNEYENNKVHEMSVSLEKGIHFFDFWAFVVCVVALVLDMVIIYSTCVLENVKIKNEDLELEPDDSTEHSRTVTELK